MLTRLRIGGTFLMHKFLMAGGAERQVPQCSTCHVDLTVFHILVECPALRSERRDNYLADKTLKQILDESAPVEHVFKFLKEINLFHDIQ